MEQVKDFFGDELQVGKKYVFMLRSGNYYQAVAEVVSIGLGEETVYTYGKGSHKILVPVVKVKRNGEKYHWQTRSYKPYDYVKRIYNWSYAVPVPEGK